MSSEMWFRIAFVVAFIALASVGAAAAKRSSTRHGAALNHLEHEVKGLIAIRGALGLVFYSSLIAWLFWPGRLAWMYLPIPESVRWIGVALMIPAIAFMAWSFSEMRTNYRGGIGLYDEHELVTSGPYRFIRHPIYLGFIIMMLLVLLISSNWLLGLSGLVLVSIIPIRRLPTEEQELGERFGSSWDDYASRTGMFFPR